MNKSALERIDRIQNWAMRLDDAPVLAKYLILGYVESTVHSYAVRYLAPCDSRVSGAYCIETV